MNWHSQYGEDALLARIFERPTGVCVEVGANDGATYSNTKYFEELGWVCILIEPAPHLFSQLQLNRKGIQFNCAASSKEAQMVLHIPQGYDLFSSLEPQSTMSEELSKTRTAIESVIVPVRPLDSILYESGVGAIDFVSIDVEGHELEVLRGFDLTRWNPTIVLIEDKSDLKITDVERHMATHGYQRFYRSGGNDWYTKPAGVDNYLMLRMLFEGRAHFRGLLKVWLPRSLMRMLLLTRRSLLNNWR
jgi:FkbM family methyltransferase